MTWAANAARARGRFAQLRRPRPADRITMRELWAECYGLAGPELELELLRLQHDLCEVIAGVQRLRSLSPDTLPGYLASLDHLMATLRDEGLSSRAIDLHASFNLARLSELENLERLVTWEHGDASPLAEEAPPTGRAKGNVAWTGRVGVLLGQLRALKDNGEAVATIWSWIKSAGTWIKSLWTSL